MVGFRNFCDVFWHVVLVVRVPHYLPSKWVWGLPAAGSKRSVLCSGRDEQYI